MLNMITRIYNWWCDEEYAIAQSQLIFFERKLASIDTELCNSSNKEIRKRRIQLVIDCIKYTYNL
jgi:hypothetical protein